MISSRKIDDLRPFVAARADLFLDKCNKELAHLGVTVIVTSTYRDNESQNALYAQGRTKPGAIVTNARGGDSFHNYRVAMDIVPLRHGKPVWGTTGNGIDNNPADDERDDLELWQRIAAIAKTFGFEWAGEWKTFKEYPHIQMTAGLTIADFKAGKQPKFT